MHEYLDMHPSIAMSKSKEPHYFSRDSQWEKGAGYHNSLFQQEYKTLYYGESSTTYCITEKAIERIAKSLTRPKLIFILRNPIDRTLSHYRWLCALGLERRPFERAILESGVNYDPNIDISGNYMGYIKFSQYSTYVPKWISEFGKENILFLSTEELKHNPEAVLVKCFNFLQVEEIKIASIINSNVTSEINSIVRYSWVPKLRQLTPNLVLSRLKNDKYIRKFFRRLVTKKGITPVISANDIDKITKLLEKDLTFYQTTCLKN